MPIFDFHLDERSEFTREVRLAKNARLPSLKVRVLDEGSPVDLIGATITFTMLDADSVAKVDGVAAVLDDAEKGIVRYDWAAADVDTDAAYTAKFDITVSSKKYTVPNGTTQRLLVKTGNVEAPALSLFVGIPRTAETGITASTTQSQGQQPLTKDINVVGTVATDDDTVTLPTASTGRKVKVVNTGTNRLQVFPASADQIDNLSANASVTIEPNSSKTFEAPNATNWYTLHGDITVLKSFTVAGLPDVVTGGIIYVSNGAAGSPVLAFSDGTNWLRCDTRAAVSAS